MKKWIAGLALLLAPLGFGAVINGPLTGASLELSNGAPTAKPTGRIYYDTATGFPMVCDGAACGSIATASLGYTPENVANKSTSTSLGASNTLYPTQNAVKTYVDSNPLSAITALTGDVTASGPGSVAATVATVGGSTAAAVGTATVLANAATAVNTASAILRRDGSGQVAATTFTGALAGTATTATNATNTAVTDDTTTNATMYPTWVTTTSGNLPQKLSSSKLTFNPSSGTLTATTFVGALTGNASTVTTNANLTGDVTSSGNATTIANNVVTNAKLATMATASFKGRTTGGTGNVEDLTATQATAILNAVVGDSGSGGTKGLVPAPASGDAAALKFLKADGTWATTPGTGTVTSVAMTVPTFLSIAGSPVTTSGTLAVSLSGTALPVANGGTGLTSGTSGGVLSYTAAGTLASSSLLGANELLIGGGAGSGPSSLGSKGTTSTLLHGNASGAPSFGAVQLTSEVAGALPLVNGGTGTAAGSANAAFNALSPMSAGGDLIYGGASGVATRLANGTAGQFLASAGTTAAPVWTSFPRSECLAITGAGHGSTNTKIRRFTTVSCSGDITGAQSSTDGDTFTVATAGIYAMSFQDDYSGSGTYYGISKNSNQLTTNVNSLTDAHIVAFAWNSNNRVESVSSTQFLAAGTVVRAHDNGTSDETAAGHTRFVITKVSN